MTREAAAQAIRDAIPVRPTAASPVPVEAYLNATAQAFGLAAEELLGRSRVHVIVNARHVAMALIYTSTQLSSVQVGDEFDRDHTTVLSAVRRVAATPELAAYAAAVRADMEGDTDD